MTAVAEAIRYVPEDLLTRPDGELLELLDGHLVEKKMGAESGWIAALLLGRLLRFQDARHGWVFGPDVGYQCFDATPERVRKPDVSFIRRGRLPGNRIPRGHIPIVPDLAVEVVSPNDSYYEVSRKVSEYLDAGVPLIWVINPDERQVEIREGRGLVTVLGEDDLLTGGSILPGFECLVRDLFQPIEDAE